MKVAGSSLKPAVTTKRPSSSVSRKPVLWKGAKSPDHAAKGQTNILLESLVNHNAREETNWSSSLRSPQSHTSTVTSASSASSRIQPVNKIMDAEHIRKHKDADKLMFEFEHPAKEYTQCAYQLQGNRKFETDYNVSRRRRAMKHAAVRRECLKLWDLVSPDGKSLSKQDYIVMHARLCKALRVDFDQLKATSATPQNTAARDDEKAPTAEELTQLRQMAETEWEHDMSRQRKEHSTSASLQHKMSRMTFVRSMIELADLWSGRASHKSSVKFLKRLRGRLCEPSPSGKPKTYGRYGTKRSYLLATANAFQKIFSKSNAGTMFKMKQKGFKKGLKGFHTKWLQNARVSLAIRKHSRRVTSTTENKIKNDPPRNRCE